GRHPPLGESTARCGWSPTTRTECPWVSDQLLHHPGTSATAPAGYRNSGRFLLLVDRPGVTEPTLDQKHIRCRSPDVLSPQHGSVQDPGDRRLPHTPVALGHQTHPTSASRWLQTERNRLAHLTRPCETPWSRQASQ